MKLFVAYYKCVYFNKLYALVNITCTDVQYEKKLLRFCYWLLYFKFNNLRRNVTRNNKTPVTKYKIGGKIINTILILP